MGDRVQQGEVLSIDLSEILLEGPDGVVWGLDSPQLNANLVKLDAGREMPEHSSDEVDVLIVVQSGDGAIIIDGIEHAVKSQSIVLIPRGCRRSIRANRRLIYFSIHTRRGAFGPR